jgi:hypothetical protein
MLGVTLFGIFLTPVFYYVIQWWTDRRATATEARASLREPNENGNGSHQTEDTSEVAATPL